MGSQNPHLVQINFIIASAEIPLAFIISICCALGFLIGIALCTIVLSKAKLQNRQLRRQNQKLSSQFQE
ncbi:lipopolysaccharide assembly protein LapA domain-containing protein [Pseudoalteromonas sp.]|uniref:lipopolysaccharide assembly protein LapA domain-containing protein n=1 Tax=Pseudoalteromonas sp. TaxID=53249 RepID=UPI003567CF85